ncbi:polyprenyl synthetase family protein [Gracilimonas sp. Q87]|uniref:polyprenyl synthetase family protein n=1 Tax=Gracilimonas sp. Q87 TaxID=3384766 RepID=UPI003983FF45
MSKTGLQYILLEKVEQALQQMELPDSPISLYEPYKYAMAVGGKRIRPLLTLIACGLCEGEIDDALPAALAVEVLHNFTLVHDDIMDSADTRRGEQSVYKKWNENTAILTGDVMFADAYKHLHYYGESDKFSKQEFAAMHHIFSRSIITVCEGQALDMEFVDRIDVSNKEYLQMIGGKTAALLSGSLEMGAVAAHATHHKRAELAELGYEMGVAFQIQDDLLDAIADPEKFGKRPGGDIYEGKKTYLTILALERADDVEQKIISNTLEQDEPTEEAVEQVLEIMGDLGVLKDVDNETDEHYQKAFDLLSKFENSEYKIELEKLLNFLRKRDH